MQQPEIPELMQITVMERVLLSEFLEAAGPDLKDIPTAIWMLPAGPKDNLPGNLIMLRRQVRDKRDTYIDYSASDPEAAAELLDKVRRCIEHGQGMSLLDVMRLELLKDLLCMITNETDFQFGLIPTINKWLKVAKTM